MRAHSLAASNKISVVCTVVQRHHVCLDCLEYSKPIAFVAVVSHPAS